MWYCPALPTTVYTLAWGRAALGLLDPNSAVKGGSYTPLPSPSRWRHQQLFVCCFAAHVIGTLKKSEHLCVHSVHCCPLIAAYVVLTKFQLFLNHQSFPLDPFGTAADLADWEERRALGNKYGQILSIADW